MKMVRQRGFVSVAAALVIMAVMTSSFLAGVSIGHGNGHDYVVDGTPVPTELRQPLSDFWQGYQHLNNDSYFRPFPDQKLLMYHAIAGMLGVTQDPHTVFIPPSDNAGITRQLNEGNFGIGAEVQMEPQGLVLSPLVDSPALKAGLRPGDFITHVDGRDVRTMQTDRAVALIHGNFGTIVRLTIVRPGVAQPFEVRVARGSIPSVLANTFGSIGYIGFYEFGQKTATEVHDALLMLIHQHVTGLIIDLRDNGGGYVDTARDIASEFLPKRSVIFWERSNLGGGRFSDAATSVETPGIAQKLPIVVLVNANSASAAEILTAALREHGRAKVLGTTTYGKGSVQEDLPLNDGASLRITIHLWLTPQKHQIDQRGIVPDLVVPRLPQATDNQVARAVQLLLQGQ